MSAAASKFGDDPAYARRYRAQIEQGEVDLSDLIAEEGVKPTQEVAEYDDGPVEEQPCRACSMFEPPGGCSAVRGAISPTGHCKFWEARGAEDAQLQQSAINLDYDVRWMSVKSRDGRTTYVDRSLPCEVENNGKPLVVAEPLREHEDAEFEDMRRQLAEFVEKHGREPDDAERERIYLRAHRGRGIPAERAWIESRGYDWAAWEAFCRGELARLEKKKAKRPPPDADVRPIQHGRGELESTLDDGAEDCEKSRPFLPLSRDEQLALDRSSVREKDQDGRLHVEVTNISKANICPYLGKEIPGCEEMGLQPDRVYKLLRDPEELARAAATFNNQPLLSQHVPVFAADYAEQAKRYVIGSTGTDAMFEAPYLRNSLVVWDGSAIALIESEEQKELSAGYHYKPDMQPGVYEGEEYDGVMRDIVGNHVALVREGRAGADVVVGDSKEKVNMAKKMMTRQAAVAIGVLAPYVRSRMAADKRIDLRPALIGLTAEDVKERKPAIVKALQRATRGKLAKDTSLGEVAEFLDMLEGHSGDDPEANEEVPPELHESLEKSAQLEPSPKSVAKPKPATPGEEAEEEGEDPAAAVEAFLKGKLDEADVQQVIEMLRKGGVHAHDAEGGEEKLEELGAAHDAEHDAETEQEHRDNEQEWRRRQGATDDLENENEVRNMAQTDGKQAKDQPPGFKGSPKTGGKMAGDKSVVTRAEMDAALRAAADSVRRTEREIREAERVVQPWVGQLNMTFDSAEEVYRKSLKMMGVKGIEKVHADALRPILEMQPKPGSRRATSARVAEDAAVSVDSFAQRFPDATRIRLT